MAWQTKKLKAEDLEKKEEVATFTKKKENGTFEKEEIKDFYENPEIPFEKGPTRTSPKIWLLIFLSLVFGFLGGLAVNFFVFRNGVRTKEVSLITEKNVTVSQDLRLREIAERLKSQILNVYLMKEAKDEEEVLSKIYLPEETLTQAGILTADGWLLSAFDFSSQNKYLVYFKAEPYQVEKIIKDPLTGLNFLKIEAKNLPVINFVTNREEITQGKQVVFFDHSSNLFTDFVSQPLFLKISKKEDLIRSTDYFSEGIALGNTYLEKKFLGSFIFGLDGLATGVIGKTKIIPSLHFQRAIKSLLEKKEISVNFLGIKYIKIKDFGDRTLIQAEKGVLVFEEPEKETPAALSGIKKGDVILKIDNTILEENVDFTDLVQKKKAGETALTILREGKEMEIKVLIKESLQK